MEQPYSSNTFPFSRHSGAGLSYFAEEEEKCIFGMMEERINAFLDIEGVTAI